MNVNSTLNRAARGRREGRHVLADARLGDHDQFGDLQLDSGHRRHELLALRRHQMVRGSANILSQGGGADLAHGDRPAGVGHAERSPDVLYCGWLAVQRLHLHDEWRRQGGDVFADTRLDADHNFSDLQLDGGFRRRELLADGRHQRCGLGKHPQPGRGRRPREP